jgi:hypothetical protein
MPLPEAALTPHSLVSLTRGTVESRCNPGQSHENGAIESRHDSLKTALDQALRLRGSRCFDDRSGYETFVEQIVQRFNARAAKRQAVERSMLRPLPPRRTAEYDEMPAQSASTPSLPSRACSTARQASSSGIG